MADDITKFKSGAENGKTLEQLAEEAEEMEEGTYVRGSNRQLSFDVGGKADDLLSSKIILAGEQFPVLGQFPQGKRIRLTVEIEIGDITFQQVKDKAGNVVGRRRIHKAAMVQAPEVDRPAK